MRCKHIAYRLNALLDNELNDKEKSEILNHLKTCHNCQNELYELKELNHQLAFDYTEDINAEIYKSLIEKSGFVRTKRSLISIKLVPVASMFLAVVLGTYISNVTFNQDTTTSYTSNTSSVQTYYDQQTLYATLEEVTQ